MILNMPTNTKLQLVTDAAATVDVECSYVDISTSTFLPTGAGSQVTAITTANTTDVLATPAASTIRVVKGMTVRNKSASTAVNVTVVLDVSATDYEKHKVLLQPGEMLAFSEGVGFFTYAAASSGFGDVLERRLDATQTGSNATGAQSWFPTLGSCPVEASTTYDFRGLLNMTRAAGTTSHTTSLLFGGTATLNSILWRANVNTGDTLANAASNHAAGRSAAAVVVKAASTSATEEFSAYVWGSLRVNAAGTFIPQFSYSAAPGGAPTIQIGSFFQLVKKGASFSNKGWT